VSRLYELTLIYIPHLLRVESDLCVCVGAWVGCASPLAAPQCLIGSLECVSDWLLQQL